MKTSHVIKAFFIATVTALTLRLFVIEDYRITSDSMMPNLLKGDLVLVSKSAFNLRLPFSSFELVRTGKPAREDIVAFSVPGSGNETYIKRIVGVGGDRIEIKKGELWLNGEVVRPSYSLSVTDTEVPDYGPIDIPEAHFFALGDKRTDSIDSRVWGPIPYSCLKGRVSLVWLSINHQGQIRSERWLSSIQ